MMKLYPEAGDRPEIDLSDVVFDEGYIIPRSSDLIATDYQKGFPVGSEILRRWSEGESFEIASEFVMHYYRSIGHGETVSVVMTSKHDDMIGGVVVIAKDTSGFDWFSHTVWPSRGRLCIEDNR